MKLTRRQEEFIRKLLDLYREAEGPIHYSELAERLGVNRFTAYDMLRLLEEKGLATSEYQLAKDKSGPGRASVVFLPTPQAHQMMSALTGESGGLDWEAVKDRILGNIRSGQVKDADPELAEEMFARFPPDNVGMDSALSYCMEVMTIIALHLSRSARRQLLVEYFPEILPGKTQTNLCSLSLLGGFTLGVLANEQGDGNWNYELFQHVKQYQQLVADMDSRQRSKLVTSLKEIFSPLILAE